MTRKVDAVGFSTAMYDYRVHSNGLRRKHMTPLIMALKLEPEEGAPLVAALIDAGADVSVKAPTGASAMQLGKTPEIKALLRSGRWTGPPVRRMRPT